MTITVDWSWLGAKDEDALWDDTMCLYAYMHPTDSEVLYIGKADFSSPHERLRGAHKREIYAALERERGIRGFRPFHGEILLPERHRRSSELVSDIESLLIKRLQPWANTQSRVTRISRSGMRVECTGDWPLKRTRFHDVGRESAARAAPPTTYASGAT